MAKMTLETPVSITRTESKFPNAKGIKTVHRLGFYIDDITQIPEGLFAVRINDRAKDEARRNDIVYSWLSFVEKKGENTEWSRVAQPGISTISTATEIKSSVVEHYTNLIANGTIDSVRAKVSIKMPDESSRILLKNELGEDALYTVYDVTEFPGAEGQEGDPGYYIKPDVPITVSLEPKTSDNGKYMQVRMRSEKLADEVFKKKAKRQTWGGAAGAVNTMGQQTPQVEAPNAEIPSSDEW